MKKWLSILLLGLLVWRPEARADVIINMTHIGDAGNVADEHWWGSHGSVPYTYQISTYEVSVWQYTAFLNAVAASDPNGLWSENMGSDPLGASILRSGESGSYIYTAVAGKENEPVRSVNFNDACRFCNWLVNGQGSGGTEVGSYTLSLGMDITRSAGATWVLPSEDEWYKAAYYDPIHSLYYDYPNGTVAVLGVFLTLPLRCEFPRRYRTVRDLIQFVTTLDSGVWSREEIFHKIRAITVEQLGVQESQVTSEASFVDDLGVG